MKFLRTILMAAVLCLPLATQAQFFNNPVVVKSMIAGTGPYVVAASTIGTFSTNLSSTVANICGVGAKGFAVGYNIAGTNSLTVTNLGILLATSSDGVNFTTNTPAGGVWVIATPSGTSYKPLYTNLLDTIQGLNLGNLAAVRVHAIANTNGDHNIYITNLTISTR
jgi:hypothetical protein